MLDCWVYEVNPPVESNYAKVRYWISKGYKTMIRADGLNSKGQPIKRFTFNSVIEAEDTVVIGEMKVAKLTPEQIYRLRGLMCRWILWKKDLAYKVMKVRIDLHCHSRFSSDGVSEPEEMVQAAKDRGLHGFAITDHNTSACVDYFLSTGLMREDGKPVDGFLILPGQEITTSAGHLLALGVRLPDLKGISPLKL